MISVEYCNVGEMAGTTPEMDRGPMAVERIKKAGMANGKSRPAPLSGVGEIEVKWGNKLQQGAAFPLAERGRHPEYS